MSDETKADVVQLFTKDELTSIAGLVDLAWKNGSVRSPQDANHLQNLATKALKLVKG